MAGQPVVYVTREIPRAGLDRLEGTHDVVVWDDDEPPPRDHLVEKLADIKAAGLFCNVSDTVDGAVISASPRLEAIGTMSVGYDHVDLAAAAEHDVAVGHTPGVLAETTADLAWGLLMAGARRILEADGHVHDGKWGAWGPQILLGRDVHDATLGVVGLGDIGTEFALRSAGFDMDVYYTSTSRDRATERTLGEYGIDAAYCDLEELLQRADFVSLHVPLTPETEGLVGEAELRRMGEEAVLVNTSRGEVVDTDALERALDQGWIRHAALDVTDPEPLPPAHPLTDHAPGKLTLTPHIGSASAETRSTMATMTAENIVAGIRGDPVPNSALADAGYERPHGL